MFLALNFAEQAGEEFSEKAHLGRNHSGSLHSVRGINTTTKNGDFSDQSDFDGMKSEHSVGELLEFGTTR